MARLLNIKPENSKHAYQIMEALNILDRGYRLSSGGYEIPLANSENKKEVESQILVLASQQPEKETATLSPEQQSHGMDMLYTLLCVAHDIVVGAIKGDKLDAGNLENYYSTYAHLFALTAQPGDLISEETIEKAVDSVRPKVELPTAQSE